MSENGEGTVGTATVEKAPVGANGAVNFDQNLVPATEQRATEVIEAAPAATVVGLGNVRELAATPVVAPVVVKPEMHTINVSIDLTLNSGFVLIQGMKELKSVAIERDGVVETYNFYNPFVRADKDRKTSDGLLRKSLGSIAKIANKVLGKPVLYIGDTESMKATLDSMAADVCERLRGQFPIGPDERLFDVELDLGDGETTVRPVEFGELFAIHTWVTSERDDEACVTTHTVHFNILMNVGAVYDSQEPHAFVRKTKTFLEGQLAALGLSENIEHHVNYAFDSATLADQTVLDMLEILISEDGYEVVSKAGVMQDKYDWIPSKAVEGLYGYGSDIILRSPDVSASEDSEADSE